MQEGKGSYLGKVYASHGGTLSGAIGCKRQANETCKNMCKHKKQWEINKIGVPSSSKGNMRMR